MVKLLAEKRPEDVGERKQKTGKTALHLATEMNNMEMVRVLCAANPQAASIQDQQGRTAMHLACAKNNLEMVKCMCEASTLAISMQDKQRETPLNIARSNERGRQTFDFLISVIGKYMAKPDGCGQMALHFLCSSGFNDLFPDWLSRNPSALEKFDENGQSCLMAALNGHHLELARSIICLLYTSPSPRDGLLSRMPSSA